MRSSRTPPSANRPTRCERPSWPSRTSSSATATSWPTRRLRTPRTAPPSDEELLADLDEAATTFAAAADAARLLDEDTTAEELFSGAQAFGEFPAAFAAADLDFGEDVPPGVAEAEAADDTCRDTQNHLVAVLGG